MWRSQKIVLKKKYQINTFISKETTSRALETNALTNSSNLKGLAINLEYNIVL